MKKYSMLAILFAFVFAMPAYAQGPVSCADCSINGGGHILEDTGGKRKDWHDISFAGWVKCEDDAVFSGEFEVNFHDVSVDFLNKGKFHATNIVDANFYLGTTCNAMNFTATGDFNGMPGYTIIFRAGDSGSPNTQDTARIGLYYGFSLIYDTHHGDFADESNCVGTARTGLDKGNITICINP